LSVDAQGFDLVAVQSLDWPRQRPTAICVEDMEAYYLGFSGTPQFSAIRAFLHMRDYWLVSQALVSFTSTGTRSGSRPAGFTSTTLVG